ncbi:MAG: chemotaxis protein CheA [Gemmatimonadetes bacterium]|nr:chemotaxis protein CheA [Gemmatimonadota bacterium]
MDPAKYAELFLAESREHLGTLNQQLLAWEKDPTATEPIGTLFRAVHTIKGMAATMGYTVVANIAHRVENLLDLLRKSDKAVLPDTIDLLFQSADALEQAVEGSVVGEEDAVDVAELLHQLDQAVLALEPSKPRGKTPAPQQPSEQPDLGGRGVRVVVRHDAPLKGVRALLVLRNMQELGTVAGVRPAEAALEADEFDGEFEFRLAAEVSNAVVETRIRAAGDIKSVEISEVAQTAARQEETRAGMKTRHVRVDLQRFDNLMDLIGELVTARSRLVELAADRADPELEDVALRITHLSSALQTEIIETRMTPVWHVFDRFPRLVRDVGRQLDKRVTLHLEGKDIELDRAILDEIGDLLVHLLRNAIDHGIEKPEEREGAGKPPEGRIELSAARDRSTIVIRVKDDGRGIDKAKILEDVKQRGLVDPETETLTDDILIRVLSQPGFSTAKEVSELSGRGVGLDVVATQLQALGGSLDIDTELGLGSTFTLRLPPTLAIIPALLARVGEERYALPLTHVDETLDFESVAIADLDGTDAMVLRDQVVPLVHLRAVVGVEGEASRRRPVIILEIGDRKGGLVVDHLLGQRDIVVKGFDAPAGTLPIFSGATILGDGQPILILDAARLV